MATVKIHSKVRLRPASVTVDDPPAGGAAGAWAQRSVAPQQQIAQRNAALQNVRERARAINLAMFPGFP